jgi:hypothetical protein
MNKRTLLRVSIILAAVILVVAGGNARALNQQTIYLPLTFGPPCGNFFDDFSNPESGWPISEDEIGMSGYTNGEYQVKFNEAGWRYFARPGVQATDFIVEVDVRKVSDGYGTYGILVGISDDWSEFYSFEIDPEGYVRFYTYQYGTWYIQQESWKPSINQGNTTNHLKIVRNGQSIRAWVNNDFEEEYMWVSGHEYTGQRYIGLIVSNYDDPNLDVRFDNFSMEALSCGAGTLKSDGQLSIMRNWERGEQFIRSPNSKLDD